MQKTWCYRGVTLSARQRLATMTRRCTETGLIAVEALKVTHLTPGA